MVSVHVSVGVGTWKARATVQPVSAPHAGDNIAVSNRLVYRDRVVISEECVMVEETRRFVTQHQADHYFDPEDA